MTATYTNAQSSKHVGLAIKIIALILMFSLFTLAFAPPVHANILKKIAIYLGSLYVGDIVLQGSKWIATEAVKFAIAYPGVALAIAAVAVGCTYMVYSMPTDTYPKAYKPNAYWDSNNGYWVMMQSAPIDMMDERMMTKN